MNSQQPCLPSLFPGGGSEPPREKKRGHVRQTSVETYQAVAAQVDGRAGNVRRWLLEHWDMYRPQFHPTSAELARFATDDGDFYDETPFNVFSEAVLYVRRGLSDLAAKRIVEVVPHGQRKCDVTKRKCETWRVRQR